MSVLKFLMSALLLLFFVPKSVAQKPAEISKQIFNYLKNKDYAKIDALFDTTGILNFVTGMQKENYKKDLLDLGSVKSLLNTEEESSGFKTRIAMGLQFKDEKQVLYILFNAKHRIEEFSFDTYTEKPFFQLKGYTGFAEVTDWTTSVKTRDGLTLEANIAFGDTSKQKSPLVIFVHGSGPNDRDETFGPNKPFRDLAQGLAQQGIVSLRYDKRTFTYQYDAKTLGDNMTLYEETVYDAIDAVKTAKQFSFVDPTRIYIVGHSQGAMCAPKIAELCPELKGIVMMAAPASNLVDIIPQQVEYLALLDDSISTAEQMKITSVKWMMDKIKSPTLNDKTPKGLLMGASATYWKSVLNYNQLVTAKLLKLPVFILSGGRDYQVPQKEFNTWKKELADKANVQFKLYPKLNHLFLEGEYRSEPEEYTIPGHIPQYVIDDLVKFIK
jgi:dienelactone hydrolase